MNKIKNQYIRETAGAEQFGGKGGKDEEKRKPTKEANPKGIRESVRRRNYEELLTTHYA